ncbi:hypothetical protein AQI95_02060 [Streptomyces yokosukanensis]|uniref:Uncharacterized protein n=1 Tax=Streptomyces yokosukanensis TaxID=67386 RepID=A0A101PFD6_9ACTN|nr:hypothetical protein [Streptomyces yokosukanensis]KUN10518.1 hypothetical protein AQI95_02060 [Streptomyces yokosukanensis]
MGLTSGRQDRTPQELVTELRGLAEVDWPTMWAGPPLPGQGLDMWCAQYGWIPLSFERVLQVRTDTGGEFVLSAPGGSWAPVDSVRHWVWGAGAETAEDNPAVLEAADHAWPVYLTAACSVLGEPTWEGSWSADDFPDRVCGLDLADPEDRLDERNPYRLAYWLPRSGTGPLVVMDIALAVGTAHSEWDGAANLSVTFRPRPIEMGAV